MLKKKIFTSKREKLVKFKFKMGQTQKKQKKKERKRKKTINDVYF